MAQTNRILVFDSGVGGLSILADLKERLPDCEFVYASDNAAFPYGSKSEDFLIRRVKDVLDALIQLTEPDIIIVACNTASTVVLPHIRDHFKTPVIGVVPAIKPAVAISETGTIGLLGTPATVKREYTQQLINDFATDCNVIKVGSSRLVDIAERALRGIKPDRDELSTIIAPFFIDQNLDTVVLACTHFPLILNDLTEAAPRSVAWVDSGEAIARRVKLLCESVSSVAEDSRRQAKPVFFTENAFIFTENTDETRQLQSSLERFGCTNVSYIEV